MTGVSERPRPQQVTTAAWMVVVAGVLLVASAYDAMTGLRSLDTRAMLTRALSGSGLGISLSEATGAMHVALLVSGVAAASAAVLAVYVLRGDRTARAALGGAAVVVALSAPFSGLFLGSLVALGAALLWSRPARDWFDGRVVEQPAGTDPVGQGGEPPEPPTSPESPGTPEVPPSTSPAPDQPPPHPGFGAPVTAPSYPSGQPAYGPSATHQAPGWGPRPPGPIRTATIITWVLSGIVIAIYALITLALIVQPEDLVDGFLKKAGSAGRDFSRGEVRVLVWAVCIVFELWAISACVLAYQVLRRRNWARVTLIVSAAVALGVSVVSTLSFPPAGIYIVGCGIAIGQLAGRAAKAWTSQPPGSGGPPPPPSYPQQGPPAGSDQDGQPPVW